MDWGDFPEGRSARIDKQDSQGFAKYRVVLSNMKKLCGSSDEHQENHKVSRDFGIKPCPKLWSGESMSQESCCPKKLFA
jgi:hypothetical protein